MQGLWCEESSLALLEPVLDALAEFFGTRRPATPAPGSFIDLSGNFNFHSYSLLNMSEKPLTKVPGPAGDVSTLFIVEEVAEDSTVNTHFILVFNLSFQSS